MAFIIDYLQVYLSSLLTLSVNFLRQSVISGEYLAGIECDGATYHGSPSARDRDKWSTKFGHKLRGCPQTLPLPWWALAHH